MTENSPSSLSFVGMQMDYISQTPAWGPKTSSGWLDVSGSDSHPFAVAHPPPHLIPFFVEGTQKTQQRTLTSEGTVEPLDGGPRMRRWNRELSPTTHTVAWKMNLHHIQPLML